MTLRYVTPYGVTCAGVTVVHRIHTAGAELVAERADLDEERAERLAEYLERVRVELRP